MRRLIVLIAILLPGLMPITVLTLGPEWALAVGGRFSPALAERIAFRLGAYAVLSAVPTAALSLICMVLQWRFARALGIVAAACAAVSAGVVLGVAALYGLTLRDDRPRYARVLAHATEYSASYSEDAFGSVSPGWTQERLHQVLGHPLDDLTVNDHVIHVYSRIGEYGSIVDKGFHQRLVITRRGVVEDVIRRYRTADHAPFAKLTDEVDDFLVPE